MKNILLHEPDPDIFEVINIALQQEGYTVNAFPDYFSCDFKTQIDHLKPDLLLLDFFALHTESRRALNSLKSMQLGITWWRSAATATSPKNT